MFSHQFPARAKVCLLLALAAPGLRNQDNGLDQALGRECSGDPMLTFAPLVREQLLALSYLGPGLMGPLVCGTDRMLAWGVEEMEVQLSAPEKTCRLLPELSSKFTWEK